MAVEETGRGIYEDKNYISKRERTFLGRVVNRKKHKFWIKRRNKWITRIDMEVIYGRKGTNIKEYAMERNRIYCND